MQKLGTLLFCLRYANEGGCGVGGVWKDVQETFSGAPMKNLFEDLDKVNAFRNTRVAHIETTLENADEALGCRSG
jgi:type III restriction enzyme